MTVYNMPIWLRNYEYMKIAEYYNKPKQEAEAKKWDKAKEISKPPTQIYQTKAPKK